MRREVKVEAAVKVRIGNILADAVEVGVQLGWDRAHEHAEERPGDVYAERVREQIERAVMNEIERVLDLP